MKTRFTCLDVAVASSELGPHVIGARLQNIYDINAKTFLLKFSTKESDEKLKIIIESGTRIHQTTFDFESKNIQPSFFAMKLRKFIRDRRCTAFSQVGFDRLVHFEFGHNNPDMNYHLFIEFFSIGNIILTNKNFEVLLLLRTVKVEKLANCLEIGSIYHLSATPKTLSDYIRALFEMIPDEPDGGSLKKLIKEKVGVFSSAMIGHILEKCKSIAVNKESIRNILEDFEHDLSHMMASTKGYLLLDKQTNRDDVMYQDFHCFPFCQLPKDDLIEFASFNGALDEFYSKLEYQKDQMALQSVEIAAINKLETIRKEQQNRIDGLQNIINLYLQRAKAVEANAQIVDEAIKVIQVALTTGMSWSDLEAIIKSEQSKGLSTALIMTKLKLEKNHITLKLANPTTDECIDVDVDVWKTAHANVTKLFEDRRSAISKLHRSKESFEKALKSAEKKIRIDLAANRSKTRRQQIFAKRKHLWFEKFNWFISSDNFLVLAGRDMQQNELLVKRYLKEGDIYVHADMHGAASVIVKNRRTHEEILTVPPRTLQEAGTMALCNSKAWESKIVTSAWWVYASQVSKTAPTGEFLATGSFMIRGKKNYLPPSQLVYGFGFMFVLDDDGTTKQRSLRVARDEKYGSASAEELLSQDTSKYLSMLETESEPGNEAEFHMVVPVSAQNKNMQESSKAQRKALPQKVTTETKSSGGKSKPAKSKKKLQKYANQDHEEKELRMKLLGHRGSDDRISTITDNADTVLREEKVKSNSPKIMPKEKQQVSEEYDEAELGMDELTIVDSLAGVLRGNLNHIQYLVPCCGPFSALSPFTLRVKLIPGGLKRGKAVQQSISILCNQKELDLSPSDMVEDDHATVQRRLKEMIREVPDSQLNQVMMGHVKIAATIKELKTSSKGLSKTRSKARN